MFIQSSKIEGSLWFRVGAPLVIGALLSLTPRVEAQAAPETLIVPDDGYGVTDCVADKSDCGRVVADAWCESQGHGPARAYGRADDVTGAIPAGAAAPPTQSASALVISCAD